MAAVLWFGASALVLNRAAVVRWPSAAPRPVAQAARLSAPPVLSAGHLPSLVSTPNDFCAQHEHQLGSLAEYEAMYEESVRDPSTFWSGIADGFHWETRYSDVVSSNFDKSKGKVFSEWFKGGRTNLCYNALDRQVEAGRGDQVAFFHESNDEGEELASWSYSQALDAVKRLASALKASGVRKGDRVTLFMPMVPQLPIAMLACARIGAIHSVVFGGFSAESLANRLQDAQSRVVVTVRRLLLFKNETVITLHTCPRPSPDVPSPPVLLPRSPTA